MARWLLRVVPLVLMLSVLWGVSAVSLQTPPLLEGGFLSMVVNGTRDVTLVVRGDAGVEAVQFFVVPADNKVLVDGRAAFRENVTLQPYEQRSFHVALDAVKVGNTTVDYGFKYLGSGDGIGFEQVVKRVLKVSVSGSACVPVWSCSRYGACQQGNVLPCLEVSDNHGCSVSFNGVLSGYGGVCGYSGGGGSGGGGGGGFVPFVNVSNGTVPVVPASVNPPAASFSAGSGEVVQAVGGTEGGVDQMVAGSAPAVASVASVIGREMNADGVVVVIFSVLMFVLFGLQSWTYKMMSAEDAV